MVVAPLKLVPPSIMTPDKVHDQQLCGRQGDAGADRQRFFHSGLSIFSRPWAYSAHPVFLGSPRKIGF